MKKKSKKKKSKKILKGFTLVELLAVIVILAVIMVLAIPSVITVMKSAKKKSFAEYTTKVYIKAEEKTLSDTLTDTSVSSGTIYEIKDLFDSTGNYDGYILVVKENGSYKYVITMWDDEYMITGYEYPTSESSSSSKTTGEVEEAMESYSATTEEEQEKLTKEYLVSYADGTTVTDTDGNQIKFTGTKSVEGEYVDWTAHYTNGVIDDCYMTPATNPQKATLTLDNGRTISSKYTIKGGKTYYCSTTISTDKTKCKKSLDCCTGGKIFNEEPSLNDLSKMKYYIYYPEEEMCGWLPFYYDDTGEFYANYTYVTDGAGLPATY